MAHFAHASDSQCATGRETAIHLAAKQVIAEARAVFLPELIGRAEFAEGPYCVWSEEKSMSPGGRRELQDVALEVWCQGVRPDVLATPVGESPIGIEIAVTSFVGPNKLERLRSLGRAAVEFDLRHLRAFTWESLREALLEGKAPATWCYHPARAVLEASLLEVVTEKAAVFRQAAEAQEAAQREAAQREAARDAAVREAERHAVRARKLAQRALFARTPENEAEWQWAVQVETRARERREWAEQHAEDFRMLPASEKAAAICKVFGVARLPELLRAKVPGAHVFGVAPLLWQAVCFGGVVHHAAQRNEAEFEIEAAYRWVVARFGIASGAGPDDARFAVLSYLMELDARHVLQPSRARRFRVRVASLQAFETLCAYRNRQVTSFEGLSWVAEENWPTLTAAREIAFSHARERTLPEGWVTVAQLPREVARKPLTPALGRLEQDSRLSPRVLMAYLIGAGYIQRT